MQKKKSNTFNFFKYSFIILLLSAASSSFACDGVSCNGLDPAAQFCNDDPNSYLDRFYLNAYYTVALRYSKKCHSVWAKGSTFSVSAYPTKVWLTKAKPKRGVQTSEPLPIPITSYSNTNSAYLNIYGNMYSNASLAACAKYSNGTVYCTGTYFVAPK